MAQGNNPKLLEIEKRLRAAQKTGWWKYDPEYPMIVGTTNALRTYELGKIDLGRTRKPSIGEEEEHRRTREMIQGLGVFLENCREDMAWLIARVRNLVRENQGLRIALSAAGQTKAELASIYAALYDGRSVTLADGFAAEEVRRMKRELADARKDSARLDWFLVSEARDFGAFCEWHDLPLQTSRTEASLDEWRAAIDAAMRKARNEYTPEEVPNV